MPARRGFLPSRWHGSATPSDCPSVRRKCSVKRTRKGPGALAKIRPISVPPSHNNTGHALVSAAAQCRGLATRTPSPTQARSFVHFSIADALSMRFSGSVVKRVDLICCASLNCWVGETPRSSALRAFIPSYSLLRAARIFSASLDVCMSLVKLKTLVESFLQYISSQFSRRRNTKFFENQCSVCANRLLGLRLRCAAILTVVNPLAIFRRTVCSRTDSGWLPAVF